MGRKCVVCSYRVNKDFEEDIRSFHKFPKEKVQLKTWLQNVRLTEGDLLKVKEAVVCFAHFSLGDIYESINGRQNLKHNAISIKFRSVEVAGEPSSPMRPPASRDRSVEVSRALTSPMRSLATESILKVSKDSFSSTLTAFLVKQVHHLREGNF